MKPFHPMTFWALFTAIAVGVVASDNALVACLSLVGSALLVRKLRVTGPWAMSFQWALLAGLYLILIRAITGVIIGVPRPGTVLFDIPRVALPSWLPGIRIGGAVTLERVISSVHEGLIIATVIALFGAANSVTSPKKLLRVLPSRVYQIAVTLIIATSVFPQLISSIKRIREAGLLRSGRKPRISSIALPLLEESLGRAVHLAESMEARGYGQSRIQSRYRKIKYERRDLLVILSGVSIASVLVAM
jgi:energy-coupling factor transporter transmembrane protein EcfT